MMKSGIFSKRSGAATKGNESCEFWFQVGFSGIECMYGRQNSQNFDRTVYPFGV